MVKDSDDFEEGGVDVGDLLAKLTGALRRRFLGALALLAASVVVSVTIALSLPNVYRSEATILVERQQIPDDLVRSTVTGQLEMRLRTISQEILSRTRLEELIERFGLYADLQATAPMEQVIERMRDDIGLELTAGGSRGQGATVAFGISYRGSDPRTVAGVTNALAGFYIEENLRVRERQAMGTAKFLESELEETRKVLEEQEKQVSAFKERYIGQLPQQLDANLRTLEQLNSQLLINSDNQIRSKETRTALLTQLAEARRAAGGGGVESVSARLGAMREELADLRTRYTDRYPDVVRLRDEIAALERQLREGGEPDTALEGPEVRRVKELLRQTEVEIAGLESEAENLRQSIASYQRRVENSPRREQEFQALSRDYETTQQLYRSLLSRHHEAELAESMEQRQKGEQFRVLDPALASEVPAAPKRPLIAILGLVCGLALAGAYVLGREMLDSSFHDAEALASHSDLPVLVSVPRITLDAERRKARWRTAVSVASLATGLGLLATVSWMAAHGNTRLVGLMLR